MYTYRRRSWRVGGAGRPQIQGLARALSCRVATAVACVMSSGLAKDRPARAVLRKMRHQPSCRFSQHAPTGMKRVADPGVLLQPGPGGQAVVGGQVVGHDPDLAGRVGVLDQLPELLVENAVAGGRGHGDLLAVPDG